MSNPIVSLPNSTPEELSALLNALCDEIITPEEMARLDHLLVQDAGCRRAYRELIGLHVALQFSFQGPLTSEAQSDESAITVRSSRALGPKPRLNRYAAVVALCVSAAMVIAGLIVWHFRGFGPLPQVAHKAVASLSGNGGQAANPAAAIDAAIAVLHCDAPCHWAAGTIGLEQGSSLAAGQTLDLLEGAATIRYDNGIRLVLEGPSRLTLISPTIAKLYRGKCFTSVPPPNKGFRISTPSAEIIDQGTEFGVMASEKGFSEVGVFKGKVECFAMDHSGACVDRVQLLAGEGARVDSKAAQPVQNLDAMKSSFPRQAKRPSGIRSYWRFEEEPLAPADDGLTTQVNAISDASGNGCRLDFWPGGPSGLGRYQFSNDVPPVSMFRPGSDGGRHSFDCGALSADAAGVALSAGNHGTAEAIANGFTIEGFFKTRGDLSTGKPMTILYQGEKFYSYLIGVNKSGPGTFTFFTFGSVKGKTHLAELALSNKNFADGHWHYFAARYVKGGDAGRDQMKADVVNEGGHCFSATTVLPAGFQIACSARPLLVGRQQYYANQKPKAHFNGLIDEIRIADRPLDDAELLGRLQ